MAKPRNRTKQPKLTPEQQLIAALGEKCVCRRLTAEESAILDAACLSGRSFKEEQLRFAAAEMARHIANGGHVH
jgi:hypothetical protein